MKWTWDFLNTVMFDVNNVCRWGLLKSKFLAENFVCILVNMSQCGIWHWNRKNGVLNRKIMVLWSDVDNRFPPTGQDDLNLVTRTEACAAFLGIAIILTFFSLLHIIFGLGRTGYDRTVANAARCVFISGMSYTWSLIVFVSQSWYDFFIFLFLYINCYW